MNRMRPINRRPDYRSVYGETTKWALEACVFIDDRLLCRDGGGGFAN
jgi:hypothetical protein